MAIYRLYTGELIEVKNNTELICSLRQGSKFDSESTNQEFMKSYAERLKLYNGIDIDTTNIDFFVSDLIYYRLIDKNNVTLEAAKILKRKGWKQGQTKMMYEKRKNCSVYDLVSQKTDTISVYDAPDRDELIAMCKKINYEFHFEDYKTESICFQLEKKLKEQKINLSQFKI
jgi:hypothetical protein